jgi:ATP synthase protein I
MQKPLKKPWKSYGRYGSLGIELILSMAVGYYAGHWLDGKLHTAPWLALVGFAIGLYAGFRQIFRVGRQMSAEAEREDKAAGSTPETRDEP